MTRRDCLILLRAIAAIPNDSGFTHQQDSKVMQVLARAGANMLAEDLEPADDPPIDPPIDLRRLQAPTVTRNAIAEMLEAWTTAPISDPYEVADAIIGEIVRTEDAARA